MAEAKKKFKPQKPKFNLIWLYVAIMVAFFAVTYFSDEGSNQETDWKTFKNEMLLEGFVERVVVINNETVEVYLNDEGLSSSAHSEVADDRKGPQYNFSIGSVEYFQKQLDEAQKENEEIEKISPRFETRENWFANIFSWLLPIIIIVAIWLFILRRFSGKMGGGGAGGNPFSNTAKSKHKIIEGKDKINVTFDDVAGLDEAKEEIMEVVDFLKSPERYKKLGATIPKGVLLTGPPGTGKTLMAKAMAGEAGVPFFTISGSDFVEMFVGVGAARVRDLFEKGREKAPCIIFIDEIEAIGRSRGRSQTQTNDERENTLNQLLVEMDGFNTEEKTVIILAATNRPDLLDNALTRPGRFDRQILIDKPDVTGREAIFKVHLKKLTLDDSVDAEFLAKQTPGFAGAEIKNICNEAALHAARHHKEKIDADDFNAAIDRVIGGMEKRNKLISKKEKEIIAYHETGHAVCGWFLEHAHPLVKVSIIPRGAAALGFAQYLPKEKNLYTYEELKDTVCMTLGGRVIEEMIFNDISTGAQNDLERTTQMSYAIIALYGMNKEIGPFSFKDLQNEYSLKQPYSEDTAKMIDIEARKFMNECYERTRDLLNEHMDKVQAVAKVLKEKEVLTKDDFEEIVGPRPFDEED